MCKLWQLVRKMKLVSNQNMIQEQQKEAIDSDLFQEHILTASVTKYPDIYYVNKFTDKYQHLFQVIGSDLHMRPSNLPQNDSASITLNIILM